MATEMERNNLFQLVLVVRIEKCLEFDIHKKKVEPVHLVELAEDRYVRRAEFEATNIFSSFIGVSTL
jgi:hypothetical protein